MTHTVILNLINKSFTSLELARILKVNYDHFKDVSLNENRNVCSLKGLLLSHFIINLQKT
jgi:hypothetical protein